MPAVALFQPGPETAASYVVRRQGPPDTLERKLTHRLNLYRILDRHQYPRTDKYLPGLGFIAEARGNIGHRADGGIVETPLETRWCRAWRTRARCRCRSQCNGRADATSPSVPRYHHAFPAP